MQSGISIERGRVLIKIPNANFLDNTGAFMWGISRFMAIVSTHLGRFYRWVGAMTKPHESVPKI